MSTKFSPATTATVGYIYHRVSSGTNGGTFTSGSYQTRPLNTTDGDFSEFGTLACCAFTLESGKYHIEVDAYIEQARANKSKIYNTSDCTDAILGMTLFAGVNGEVTGFTTTLSGVVEISTTKTFELQHRGGTTVSTFGFGRASSFGDEETYAIIKIEKIE